MRFTKGKSGNPSGRPKGKRNKVTNNIKSWLVELVDKNRKQIEDDLKELSPMERLKILEKFISYITPKEASLKTDINLDEVDEHTLDVILQKLAKR